MVAGPMAREVAATFDDYWNSEHAFPVILLPRDPRPRGPVAVTQQGAARQHRGERREAPPFTLEPSDWSGYLEELVATFAPARSEVLWESPEILNEARPRLYDDFKAFVASARSEVMISSPYFIPDAEFRELLRDARREGRARRRRHELARDEQPRRRAHGLSALAARDARGRRRALRAALRCRGACRLYVTPPTQSQPPRAAHESRRRRRRTRFRRLAERRSALDGAEYRDRRRRRQGRSSRRASRRSSSATFRRRTRGASRWTRKAGSRGRAPTKSCGGNPRRASVSARSSSC